MVVAVLHGSELVERVAATDEDTKLFYSSPDA